MIGIIAHAYAISTSNIYLYAHTYANFHLLQAVHAGNVIPTCLIMQL